MTELGLSIEWIYRGICENKNSPMYLRSYEKFQGEFLIRAIQGTWGYRCSVNVLNFLFAHCVHTWVMAFCPLRMWSWQVEGPVLGSCRVITKPLCPKPCHHEMRCNYCFLQATLLTLKHRFQVQSAIISTIFYIVHMCSHIIMRYW